MEHGFTGHEHYDRFVKVRGERGKVKGTFGSKTLQQLISNSPLTFPLSPFTTPTEISSSLTPGLSVL